jgi:hypothetical protein
LRQYQALALDVDIGSGGHVELGARCIEADDVLASICEEFAAEAGKVAVDGCDEAWESAAFIWDLGIRIRADME